MLRGSLSVAFCCGVLAAAAAPAQAAPPRPDEQPLDPWVRSAGEPAAPEPEPEIEVDTEPPPEPASEPTPEAAAPSDPWGGEPPPTLDRAPVWRGLVGYRVLVYTADNIVRGRLLGQHSGGVLIARDRDGQVVDVPREVVRTVQVDFGRSEPVRLASDVKSGQGLLGGGISLLIHAAGTLVTGVVFMYLWPNNLELSLPMVLTGGPATAGAIAMIAVGTERHRHWLRARREVRDATAGRRIRFEGPTRLRF